MRLSLGRAVHTHFFSLHCWNAASVSRLSAAISSGSGSALKLKQVLPCIRFFKADPGPELMAALRRLTEAAFQQWSEMKWV